MKSSAEYSAPVSSFEVSGSLGPFDDLFRKVLSALAPYRGDIVLVGAWAHRLYRHHPLATPNPRPPLTTEDVDMALRPRISDRNASILELLGRAGFEEKLRGFDDSLICRYEPRGLSQPFYVEFIAPDKSRAPSDRSTAGGRSKRIGGVLPSKLRFVEILLDDPWSARLQGRESESLEVMVANPASFLAQKVLSLPRRRALGEKAKDLLYLHDTLELFGTSLPALRPLADRVLDRRPARQRTDFQKVSFGFLHDDSIVAKAIEIAEKSRGGRVRPETFVNSIHASLRALFGAASP